MNGAEADLGVKSDGVSLVRCPPPVFQVVQVVHGLKTLYPHLTATHSNANEPPQPAPPQTVSTQSGTIFLRPPSAPHCLTAMAKPRNGQRYRNLQTGFGKRARPSIRTPTSSNHQRTAASGRMRHHYPSPQHTVSGLTRNSERAQCQVAEARSGAYS